MVVHWTETFTNKNIGSEEIDAIQRDLGGNGIGYHYVIRRDGSLQRGRPNNIEGEHAAINGHNEFSIGIVLSFPVGGNLMNPNSKYSFKSTVMFSVCKHYNANEK